LSGDSQDVAAHLTFFWLTLGGSINCLPSTSSIGSVFKNPTPNDEFVLKFRKP
jgi:hypothetical protein